MTKHCDLNNSLCQGSGVCYLASIGKVRECCLAPSANLSSVVWTGQSRAALSKHFGIERKHLLFTPDGNAYFRKNSSVGFEKFPLLQIGVFWYQYFNCIRGVDDPVTSYYEDRVNSGLSALAK